MRQGSIWIVSYVWSREGESRYLKKASQILAKNRGRRTQKAMVISIALKASKSIRRQALTNYGMVQ